jgi:hypothetical protein
MQYAPPSGKRALKRKISEATKRQTYACPHRAMLPKSKERITTMIMQARNRYAIVKTDADGLIAKKQRATARKSFLRLEIATAYDIIIVSTVASASPSGKVFARRRYIVWRLLNYNKPTEPLTD